MSNQIVEQKHRTFKQVFGSLFLSAVILPIAWNWYLVLINDLPVLYDLDLFLYLIFVSLVLSFVFFFYYVPNVNYLFSYCRNSEFRTWHQKGRRQDHQSDPGGTEGS